MAKIDLKSAYDEFTQEDLFRQVCKENIGDASEYDRDQVDHLTFDNERFDPDLEPLLCAIFC